MIQCYSELARNFLWRWASLHGPVSDLALDTASRHIQRSGVTTLKLNPLSPIMTSKDVKVCYGYRCHHDVFRRYVGCWPGAARQPAILLHRHYRKRGKYFAGTRGHAVWPCRPAAKGLKHKTRAVAVARTHRTRRRVSLISLIETLKLTYSLLPEQKWTWLKTVVGVNCSEMRGTAWQFHAVQIIQSQYIPNSPYTKSPHMLANSYLVCRIP